jgi:hypothetical protein
MMKMLSADGWHGAMTPSWKMHRLSAHAVAPEPAMSTINTLFARLSGMLSVLPSPKMASVPLSIIQSQLTFSPRIGTCR